MEFILNKDTAYVGNLYLSEMGRPSRNKIIFNVSLYDGNFPRKASWTFD